MKGYVRSLGAATILVLLAGIPASVHAQIDQQRADAYFKEAAALCEREGGRLWGVSLCGPMVFADAPTKSIATNQPAPAADRPPVLGFINAPIEWGGTRWSAYLWAMISTTGATPIPSEGMVYFEYRTSADWGSLESTGILESADNTTLRPPSPFQTDGSILSGEGWKLTLALGWVARPGSRAGDFQLVRDPPK
jgi:hypothetical protein